MIHYKLSISYVHQSLGRFNLSYKSDVRAQDYFFFIYGKTIP
ncbi:hypothetical protein [Staphylococcus epidermidis]|nr:hypothetical protein [Staphylococcus epidermidis]